MKSLTQLLNFASNSKVGKSLLGLLTSAMLYCPILTLPNKAFSNDDLLPTNSIGPIAYVSHEHNYNYPNIESVYPEGFPGDTILNNSSTLENLCYPQLSLNGSRIVFSAGPTHQNDIWIMNIDGTGLTNLATGGSGKVGPDISPDGERIVFCSISYDLYSMNYDGTNLISLGPGVCPFWSPDNNQIIFSNWGIDYTNTDLFVMNANGTNKQNLTNTLGFAEVQGQWSPNGQKIAFQGGINHQWDIWVMDANGQNRTSLTSDMGNTSDEICFAWSPNGEKIAFISKYSGNRDLWVMNADGTNKKNLTNTPWDEEYPSWRGNLQPIANAGSDQNIYAGLDGIAEVSLDGSNSWDPDRDILNYTWYWILNNELKSTRGINPTINLPFGEYIISLMVNDGYLDSALNSILINVQDNIPPELSLSVSPNILWPPNHKMVQITPQWIVNDNCDQSPYVTLKDILMDEGDETNAYDPNYDDTTGDGHTFSDIQINADRTIYLRAERSGNLTGRIYTLTYTAIDSSGNESDSSATVRVPHNM